MVQQNIIVYISPSTSAAGCCYCYCCCCLTQTMSRSMFLILCAVVVVDVFLALLLLPSIAEQLRFDPYMLAGEGGGEGEYAAEGGELVDDQQNRDIEGEPDVK